MMISMMALMMEKKNKEEQEKSNIYWGLLWCGDLV